MAIAVTYLERQDQAPRNTVTVFDRFGREALTYAKVHTCDFGDEKKLGRGDRFPVAQLDTAAGPVQVGAMICYDREFPESARLLMLAGAEIILVPNACPMELNRLTQLRARAFENMVGVATANYAWGPAGLQRATPPPSTAWPTAPGRTAAGTPWWWRPGRTRESTWPPSPWTAMRALPRGGGPRQRLPPSRAVPGSRGGSRVGALPSGRTPGR